MAKAVARDLLEREEINNWMIDSAGIFAIEGQRANPNAVKVLAKRGIDLTRHKSKKIPKDIGNYDLILTMTENHRRFLLENYSLDKNKVFTLNSFAYNDNVDIKDPFGCDIEVYEDTYEELEQAINEVIKRLKNL
jgi:protein-tyrosine-phosphatase